MCYLYIQMNPAVWAINIYRPPSLYENITHTASNIFRIYKCISSFIYMATKSCVHANNTPKSKTGPYPNPKTSWIDSNPEHCFFFFRRFTQAMVLNFPTVLIIILRAFRRPNPGNFLEPNQWQSCLVKYYCW